MRVLYLLLFLATAGAIGELKADPMRDPACLTSPTCPDGSYPNICRRPCEGGGYFYQFFSRASVGCLDQTEPDPGHCLAGSYATSGGHAHMQAGVRRPGQINHEDSFTVVWTCHQVPMLDASIPQRRTFNFTYGRPPWGHGSTRIASASLSSPQWDAFLQALPLDQVDVRKCLRDIRDQLDVAFPQACRTVEEAAGLERARARDMCNRNILQTFILPKQAAIASKEISIQRAASARPLLVIGHPTNNERPEDDRREAEDIISRCSFFPWDSSYRTFYSTNTSLRVVDEIGELVRTKIPAVTPECRQRILRGYIDEMARMQRAKCNRLAYARGQACMQIRTGIAATLSKLGQAFPQEMSQYAGTLATRACVLPSIELSRELRNLQLSIETIGQCVSLGVGETRIIDHDSINSPSRVRQKYRLSRLREKDFQVEVNLTFSPANKVAEMEKHVNKCFKKANKRLIGPADKKIILKLTHDSAIPSVPINVKPADYRSDSGNWEADIDCATVTHEVMHLLGLVDEYPEKWIGNVYNPHTGAITEVDNKRDAHGNPYQTAVDCRVLGPDDSLMSNQWEAFSRASSIFRSRHGVLHTAHFNAIAYPGCSVTNRLYYLCSRYAYETSGSHYGQGCSSGQPRECANPESWLGGVH